MSDTVRTALIGGILALVGAIGGAAVTGRSQVELARQRFNSDLVMKALESNSAEQRLETLKLLVETKLLKDAEVQQGVKSYAKAKESDPSTIPQVVGSTGGSAFSYFIVEYDGPTRMVLLDGTRWGPSGSILTAAVGQHELRLEGPQDYVPAVHKVVFAGAPVNKPDHVQFTTKAPP